MVRRRCGVVPSDNATEPYPQGRAGKGSCTNGVAVLDVHGVVTNPVPAGVDYLSCISNNDGGAANVWSAFYSELIKDKTKADCLALPLALKWWEGCTAATQVPAGFAPAPDISSSSLLFMCMPLCVLGRVTFTFEPLPPLGGAVPGADARQRRGRRQRARRPGHHLRG